MRRSFLVFAVASACLLSFPACGGKSAGTAGEGTGAELAPAGSIAFISLNTERSNPEWRRAISLAARVPALQGALANLSVCLSAARPRLGKTVGVAVLRAQGDRGEDLVVITRPKDVAALERLLRLPCGTSISRTMPALAVREHGGWLLAADSQATLDRFESEAQRGTLAGSHDFWSAFDSLPKGALVRAYLNGEAVSRLFAGRLAGAFPGLRSEPSPFEWIALSARPFGRGLRLDGSVSGIEARNVPNTLIDEAPAGSLLAASIGGSGYGLDKALDEPANKTRLTWARAFLGLGQNYLATLARGEIAVYITRFGLPEGSVAIDPGSGRIVSRPAFALELRLPGAAAIAGKVEKKLPALAASLGGRARHLSIAGGRVEELTIGTLRLYFGVTKGRLFLSTEQAIVARGPRLSSLATFARAEQALALPEENAGVLYLDLGGDGATTPARAAVLAYLDASGGRVRIRGVLVVR